MTTEAFEEGLNKARSTCSLEITKNKEGSILDRSPCMLYESGGKGDSSTNPVRPDVFPFVTL